MDAEADCSHRSRRRKPPAARLLLYSHDSYGLGHFRRNLSIADAVACDMPNVSTLLLTGSPRSHSFPLPPRFDYVKIPSVTKGDGGQYRARSLSLSIAETTRLRESIVLETVRGYHPDVVLVDHSPLGMRGELRATLRALRRESPATRVVLGLRDIVDDEESVLADWAREGVLPMIEECYDRIWVYGSPDVFDPRVRYRFPKSIADRVRFLGYIYRNGVVADPAPLRAEAAARSGKLVVVTVGGGGDGHRVVRKYLSALAGYGSGSAPFDSVVVTGPLMSDRKREALEAAAKEHGLPARFVKFAPNLLDWFAAADAVVCMAGYNTMCEVAALGKRAVVIPREFPRREQAIRARRFEELGHCETLSLEALSGRAIRHSLESILDGRAVLAGGLPPSPIDFGGLKRIAPEMRDLLGLEEEIAGESLPDPSDREANSASS